MKTIYSTLILIMVSFSMVAQHVTKFVPEGPIRNYALNDHNVEKIFRDVKAANRMKFDEVQGTPYFSNDFMSGIISTKEKGEFQIPVRYNIYFDEIEYKRENGVVIWLDKQYIENISFDNKFFVCKPYSQSSKRRYTLFQKLADGEMTLLKKHNIKFIEAQIEKAYQDPKPAKFKKVKPAYYMEFGDNIICEISKKKDLLRSITAHKEEVETYLKKEKIKFNDEQDLIHLFEYYNSL